MDGLTLYWTITAKRQRDYIFDYWNKRNKSTNYSKKLNLRIKERIDLLKAHPEIGKETDFKDTRTISLGHYSILYKVTPPKLIITGFWDNPQDPKELLSFLKNQW